MEKVNVYKMCHYLGGDPDKILEVVIYMGHEEVDEDLGICSKEDFNFAYRLMGLFENGSIKFTEEAFRDE